MKNATMLMLVLVLIFSGAAIAPISADESLPGRVLPGGLELSGDLGVSTLDDQAVGLIGLKAMTQANSWLDVGLAFGAVHTLERYYEDEVGRSYQAEFAYASIVLRPHLGLGKAVDIGLPVSSGWSLLQFRYEHKYRDDMTWFEEYLDRATSPVFTAGADVRIDFSQRFGARIEGGYRQATNVDSRFADAATVSGPYAVTGMVFRPF